MDTRMDGSGDWVEWWWSKEHATDRPLFNDLSKQHMAEFASSFYENVEIDLL